MGTTSVLVAILVGAGVVFVVFLLGVVLGAALVMGALGMAGQSAPAVVQYVNPEVYQEADEMPDEGKDDPDDPDPPPWGDRFSNEN